MEVQNQVPPFSGRWWFPLIPSLNAAVVQGLYGVRDDDVSKLQCCIGSLESPHTCFLASRDVECSKGSATSAEACFILDGDIPSFPGPFDSVINSVIKMNQERSAADFESPVFPCFPWSEEKLILQSKRLSGLLADALQAELSTLAYHDQLAALLVQQQEITQMSNEDRLAASARAQETITADTELLNQAQENIERMTSSIANFRAEREVSVQMEESLRMAGEDQLAASLSIQENIEMMASRIAEQNEVSGQMKESLGMAAEDQLTASHRIHDQLATTEGVADKLRRDLAILRSALKVLSGEEI